MILVYYRTFTSVHLPQDLISDLSGRTLRGAVHIPRVTKPIHYSCQDLPRPHTEILYSGSHLPRTRAHAQLRVSAQPQAIRRPRRCPLRRLQAVRRPRRCPERRQQAVATSVPSTAPTVPAARLPSLAAREWQREIDEDPAFPRRRVACVHPECASAQVEDCGRNRPIGQIALLMRDVIMEDGVRYVLLIADGREKRRGCLGRRRRRDAWQQLGGTRLMREAIRYDQRPSVIKGRPLGWTRLMREVIRYDQRPSVIKGRPLGWTHLAVKGRVVIFLQGMPVGA